tara:strand:- start:3825 stop:4712 length:888 start_codon:yes stop_codon:yes gene_type:complete
MTEQKVAQYQRQNILEKPLFSKETSFVYGKWIQSNSKDYPGSHHRFHDLARGGSDTYRLLLTSLAIQDASFRRNIASAETSANTVMVEDWKKDWQNLMQIESNMPIFDLGFKSGDFSWKNLFSYQFLHAGFLHFLMNAFFFLLLAPLVEAAMGSVIFLFAYLFSGAFAAVFYFFLHGNSMTPLVGASGSVSFMLAFICIYLFRQKIHYFYWLLPKKGYYGFLKLSPLWALAIWLVTDLAAELSATTFASVAHSAHLGGMAVGVVLGTIYFHLDRVRGKQDFLLRRETSAKSVFTN